MLGNESSGGVPICSPKCSKNSGVSRGLHRVVSNCISSALVLNKNSTTSEWLVGMVRSCSSSWPRLVAVQLCQKLCRQYETCSCVVRELPQQVTCLALLSELGCRLFSGLVILPLQLCVLGEGFACLLPGDVTTSRLGQNAFRILRRKQDQHPRHRQVSGIDVPSTIHARSNSPSRLRQACSPDTACSQPCVCCVAWTTASAAFLTATPASPWLQWRPWGQQSPIHSRCRSGLQDGGPAGFHAEQCPAIESLKWFVKSRLFKYLLKLSAPLASHVKDRAFTILQSVLTFAPASLLPSPVPTRCAPVVPARQPQHKVVQLRGCWLIIGTAGSET